MKWGRWLVGAVVVVAVIGLGPRAAVDAPDVAAITGRIPTDPARLPAYLAQEEAAVSGIHANTEKRIVWAPSPDSLPRRTARAVVYLHGFSATRQETAPFAEDLARELGANLFETRLTGHGLAGDALEDVTAQQWLGDAVEALTIGQRLGDSVIVVGTSTGGTLALWLASQPASRRRALQALILISPNIAVADPSARVLTWPWMPLLIPRVMPSRTWTPHNAEQARYWTTTYPTSVLFPMTALVADVRQAAPARLTTPMLAFVNTGDDVVDADATRRFFERVTHASVEWVDVTPLAGEDRHVLTGRIVSPGQVRPFLDRSLAFLQAR